MDDKGSQQVRALQHNGETTMTLKLSKRNWESERSSRIELPSPSNWALSISGPGSRRRCATHKDVGGDANVNANLGSNGVLANFQLAAGQLEVHASGECQRALQHLEKDVINEERQATPLMPEPTPGVQYEFFAD
ncbi:hypothetical protein PC111_g22630 [Phytophthora cactorum]|nr:hypothetical protein PC111_g22630 [Phytophthora cactorum]